jgi:magnesium transporter
MTPDFVSVKEDWTVGQCLDYIRKYGRDSETLNNVYVTDQHGFLIDDIRVREFLLSPLDKQVSELMDKTFVALNAKDDQESAVKAFKQTDRVALPVTDFKGLLLGIITFDDVMDVMEEEDTEDIQKFGGTEALDEPYLKVSLYKMISKRAGWLVILFIGEMLTASAMAFFENEISKAVVLALFVPLIISSGGNSGSQAATLIIRAMALGEVTLERWWEVIRREFLSGLVLGTLLGSIGFLRILPGVFYQYLRTALAAGRVYGRFFADRCGIVRNHRRFHAAHHPEKTGCRPGCFFRAFYCHPRRCDGPVDLFYDGLFYTGWQFALSAPDFTVKYIIGLLFRTLACRSKRR